jgi:hypothetical protein
VLSTSIAMLPVKIATLAARIAVLPVSVALIGAVAICAEAVRLRNDAT